MKLALEKEDTWNLKFMESVEGEKWVGPEESSVCKAVSAGSIKSATDTGTLLCKVAVNGDKEEIVDSDIHMSNIPSEITENVYDSVNDISADLKVKDLLVPTVVVDNVDDTEKEKSTNLQQSGENNCSTVLSEVNASLDGLGNKSGTHASDFVSESNDSTGTAHDDNDNSDKTCEGSSKLHNSTPTASVNGIQDVPSDVNLKKCSVTLDVWSNEDISKVLNGKLLTCNALEAPDLKKNEDNQVISSSGPGKTPKIIVTESKHGGSHDGKHPETGQENRAIVAKSNSTGVDNVTSFASKKESKLPPVHSFLWDLGKSLAMESCVKNIVHQEKKEMKKIDTTPGLQDHEKDKLRTKANAKVDKLNNILGHFKDSNKSFNYSEKVCHQCGFRTENCAVLQDHMETVPHYNLKGRLICILCDSFVPVKDRITYSAHMKQQHGASPKFDKLGLFSCKYCYYDAPNGVQLMRHVMKCRTTFTVETNLAPPKGFTPALVIPGLKKPVPPPQPTPSAQRPAVQTARQLPVQNGSSRIVNGVVGRGVYMRAVPNQGKTGVNQPGQFQRVISVQKPNVSQGQIIRAGITQGGATSFRLGGADRLRQPGSLLVPSHGQQSFVMSGQQQSRPSSSAVFSQRPQDNRSILQNADARRLQMKPQTNQSAAVKRPMTACDMCGEFMTDKDSFRKHLMERHDINLHTFQYKGADRDMLLCGICTAYFTTFPGIQQHMAKNHPHTLKSSQGSSAKRVKPSEALNNNGVSGSKTTTGDTLTVKGITNCPLCNVATTNLAKHTEYHHPELVGSADNRQDW